MPNNLTTIAQKWEPLTVKGRYCGRFDVERGLLELQHRGQRELYDLAAMVTSHADNKESLTKPPQL